MSVMSFWSISATNATTLQCADAPKPANPEPTPAPADPEKHHTPDPEQGKSEHPKQ